MINAKIYDSKIWYNLLKIGLVKIIIVHLYDF